jgi:hypothetical protein
MLRNRNINLLPAKQVGWRSHATPAEKQPKPTHNVIPEMKNIKERPEICRQSCAMPIEAECF